MVCIEASPLLVVRWGQQRKRQNVFTPLKSPVVPEHSWEGLRDIPQPVWAAVDDRRAEVWSTVNFQTLCERHKLQKVDITLDSSSETALLEVSGSH